MIIANRYNYHELLAQATKPDSTAEERLELLSWFEQYDNTAWNGEYYDLSYFGNGGIGERLYPVYKELFDENGEHYGCELVDAEIR